MKKLLLMISALLCTGALAFADETADGIVPSLGFNSNITVTFTLDNLF